MASLATVFYTLPKFLKNKQLVTEFRAPISDQRVIEELKKACAQIGFSDIEEAIWVLIPKNPKEETVWLDAVGGGKDDKILSSIRLPFQVMYRPSEEEKRKLIALMQEALWVLHIHNHPYGVGLCEPSYNDICFAADWRSINSDITNMMSLKSILRNAITFKMKFFVIQGNKVVEYSGRF